MKEFWELLRRLSGLGKPHALATVVETRGSVSARKGSKAIIDENGTVLMGWVGGGCAQSTVCHTALESLQDGQPRTVDLNLDDEVLGTGMPCGGSMRVFVEPMLPQPVVWVLGHGAITEALCRIGTFLGFQMVIDDPRATSERYPTATLRITDDLDYSQLNPGLRDYVVIATQHKGDHQSLLRVLRSSCSFIGLIASAKRARLVFEYLQQEGVDAIELRRVYAPAGIDLGAETPEEIALSVLSEIVLHRRGGTGCPKQIQLAAEGDDGNTVGAAWRPALVALK